MTLISSNIMDFNGKNGGCVSRKGQEFHCSKTLMYSSADVISRFLRSVVQTHDKRVASFRKRDVQIEVFNNLSKNINWKKPTFDHGGIKNGLASLTSSEHENVRGFSKNNSMEKDHNFSDSYGLIKQKKNPRDFQYVCPSCLFSFPSHKLKQFAEHISQKGHEIKQIKCRKSKSGIEHSCPKCQRKFGTVYELLLHWSDVTGKGHGHRVMNKLRKTYTRVSNYNTSLQLKSHTHEENKRIKTDMCSESPVEDELSESHFVNGLLTGSCSYGTGSESGTCCYEEASSDEELLNNISHQTHLQQIRDIYETVNNLPSVFSDAEDPIASKKLSFHVEQITWSPDIEFLTKTVDSHKCIQRSNSLIPITQTKDPTNFSLSSFQNNKEPDSLDILSTMSTLSSFDSQGSVCFSPFQYSEIGSRVCSSPICTEPY